MSVEDVLQDSVSFRFCDTVICFFAVVCEILKFHPEGLSLNMDSLHESWVNYSFCLGLLVFEMGIIMLTYLLDVKIE